MRIFRHLSLACLTLSAAAAPAQIVYVQPPTPAADELATEMRLLGANPTDVNAMIRAGELTLKLDDPTAAAGFFARAERIDPNNPRIKAGKGSILVGQGRPNEALRQFYEAEMLRGDVRRFAADRGLAYDLIGEQDRAQRDYRLALKDGTPNGLGGDETLRRYALSLGISGKRDEALAQIDQLLRRSDRGAWRTRAFILAMTGDSAGAERIATSMMPGGMAQGLQPFFDRLPRLGAIDRAFAVHFGEVRATPQRLADARMKPALPALMPEAGRPAPVVLATAAPQVTRDDRKTEKRKSRKRGQRDRIDVASTAAPVVRLPLPQPPAYQGAAGTTIAASPTYVQPLPSSALASNPSLTSTSPPLRREPAPGFTQPLPQPLPEQNGRILANTRTTLAADRPVRMSAVPVTPQDPVAAATRPVTQPETRVTAAAPPRAASEAPFRTTPETPVASTIVTPKPVVVEARPEPAPVQVTTLPPAATAPKTPGIETSAPAVAVAAAPARVPAASPSATLPPAPGPMKGEDSILAKIIANITVPGSELDVEPAPSQPAPSQPEPTAVRVADAAPVREPAPIVTAQASAPDTVLIAERKAAAEKKAADKVLADKKLADRKVADKKVADAKKLADAKKAAEELKRKNDPKILEPARIWVQVAGGANEGDLAKEWTRVKAKAPIAFKGKSGWMTPLRATNRVLAGPFKTDAEARSFVNALSKEGLSGFSFTSEAGQKVTRLGGK